MILIVTTYNWLHGNISKSYPDSTMEESNVEKQVLIAKSPILRMVYAQKHCIENKRLILGEMTYEPQSLFINDKYVGSVARINEKTLIINLIKIPKNNYSVQLNKTFMPTHFIQNDAYSYRPVCGELEPVIRTIRFF